jgi:tetratricopeptide (TPR) repeat protein
MTELMRRLTPVLVPVALVTLPLLGTALAQSEAEEYYRKGVESMNNSRYLDAVEQFQLAVDENPDFVDAHKKMAYVYTQMAKTEEDYFQDALDKYEDILALVQTDEDQVGILESIAFVQAEMGDMDDAISTYEEILEIKPEDCGVWTRIGGAHKFVADRMKQEGEEEDVEYEGRLKKAIDAYTKVTELCPDSLKAYATLGEIFFFTDRKDDAAYIYETMLQLDPDNLDTMIRLAYLYKEEKDWAKAAPLYERILAVDPTRVSTRQGYAKALQKLGQYEKAVEQYQMIIDSDPEKYGSLYCNMANLYALDARDGEKAIEISMEGIAQNAPVKGCLTYFWGKGLELRGTDFVREGAYDRGITTYQEAIMKFQSILDDKNFGNHATKQVDRLNKLIAIAQQTKEKNRQQGK